MLNRLKLQPGFLWVAAVVCAAGGRADHERDAGLMAAANGGDAAAMNSPKSGDR
jgi:hypothetical protein